MKFMVIRRADAETEAGVMPGAELIADMTQFHEDAAKAGIVIAGSGLMPTSRGAKVKFNNGRPTVIDGPFAEAKELIAGYTLIEVPSREAAIEWVKGWPRLDGHGNVEIEIRQLFTEEDFGDAYTEAMASRDAARNALGKPE
ncbi:dehydrogenase [Devosia insulae DS-56]|uniref:Dehydrogenase n=1 Tax=Devosia insulae DS-56 TaxID=1116389 RepID=A0A1E5XV30_9HYPH|nr:YciI family protein [Devosia insulae]OEO32449.1 dehydrogenase [Devosia insulae DS-56]